MLPSLYNRYQQRVENFVMDVIKKILINLNFSYIKSLNFIRNNLTLKNKNFL